MNVSFSVPGPQQSVQESSDFLFTCLIIGFVVFLYAFRPRFLRQSNRNIIKSNNEPVSYQVALLIKSERTNIYIFTEFTWRSTFTTDELRNAVLWYWWDANNKDMVNTLLHHRFCNICEIYIKCISWDITPYIYVYTIILYIVKHFSLLKFSL